MTELVESIKEHGLLQPVLVRPIENGKYEVVSGHRRKRAFELAGLDTIPCRVQEMTLEEATTRWSVQQLLVQLQSKSA